MGSNPSSPIDLSTSSESQRARPRLERQLDRPGHLIIRSRRQTDDSLKPFTEAGLEIVDRLCFRADGPGRVIVERIDPSVE